LEAGSVAEGLEVVEKEEEEVGLVEVDVVEWAVVEVIKAQLLLEHLASMVRDSSSVVNIISVDSLCWQKYSRIGR
jgi:hypothetical protein